MTAHCRTGAGTQGTARPRPDRGIGGLRRFPQVRPRSSPRRPLMPATSCAPARTGRARRTCRTGRSSPSRAARRSATPPPSTESRPDTPTWSLSTAAGRTRSASPPAGSSRTRSTRWCASPTGTPTGARLRPGATTSSSTSCRRGSSPSPARASPRTSSTRRASSASPSTASPPEATHSPTGRIPAAGPGLPARLTSLPLSRFAAAPPPCPLSLSVARCAAGVGHVAGSAFAAVDSPPAHAASRRLPRRRGRSVLTPGVPVMPSDLQTDGSVPGTCSAVAPWHGIGEHFVVKWGIIPVWNPHHLQRGKTRGET